MNHALFCVTPSARPNSCELMPFFEVGISQTAGNHVSRASGESSKIVPTLAENCRFGCWVRHSHSRRVAMKRGALWPHVGQVTPFGQRASTIAVKHTFGSE